MRNYFMSKIPRSSQATYDADGNIILFDSEFTAAPHTFGEQVLSEPRERRTAETHPKSILSSDVSPPAPTRPMGSKRTPVAPHGRDTTPKMPHLIEESLKEGRNQISATLLGFQEECVMGRDTVHDIPKKILRAWNFAKAPIRLPGTWTRKPRTKTGMFLLDTVRFGGTFALIFGVLFVGINYQSFWQIARAQLALGTDIKTEQALQDLGSDLQGTLTIARNTRELSEPQNIRKYLPPVGPYEDRLVIPKLGKNIPIVRPSMDALMKENWKQFEDDIQAALHDGVVHYPGSARPGQAGNFFVTGHSSYYPWASGNFKEVFARLNELAVGDTYSVYYGGDRHAYRVTKKYEVRPNDVSVLDQPMDKRLSTLMTCTPVGTTLRRLIVQAEEIDPVTGDTLKVGEKIAERSTNPFTRLEALPI